MNTIIFIIVLLVKNLLRLIILLRQLKLRRIWPKTFGELRTLRVPRTFEGSNFLEGTRTLGRPATLGWPRTLKGPKTLSGPTTLAWPRQSTDKPNLICKNNYCVESQTDTANLNSDYSRDKTRPYHYQTQQFVFIWIMHMKNFHKMILLVFQKLHKHFMKSYLSISMDK